VESFSRAIVSLLVLVLVLKWIEGGTAQVKRWSVNFFTGTDPAGGGDTVETPLQNSVRDQTPAATAAAARRQASVRAQSQKQRAAAKAIQNSVKDQTYAQRLAAQLKLQEGAFSGGAGIGDGSFTGNSGLQGAFTGGAGVLDGVQ
jgi:hypothetical protein